KQVGSQGVGEEGGNSIGIVMNQKSTIEVEVIQKPTPKPGTIVEETPETNNTWLWVLGIAVVVVIVWIVLSKRKKK
ncbi:MAG: LPXTG cell wall anchor domain-containing protein, partial [archaeon]